MSEPDALSKLHNKAQAKVDGKLSRIKAARYVHVSKPDGSSKGVTFSQGRNAAKRARRAAKVARMAAARGA